MGVTGIRGSTECLFLIDYRFNFPHFLYLAGPQQKTGPYQYMRKSAQKLYLAGSLMQIELFQLYNKIQTAVNTQ